MSLIIKWRLDFWSLQTGMHILGYKTKRGKKRPSLPILQGLSSELSPRVGVGLLL